MTAFTDLSQDSQNQIMVFMGMFRQRIGAIAATLSAMDRLQQIWNANIEADVTSLDAGTVITDSPSTASGAVLLTREDMLGLMDNVATVLTNFNSPTSRANYIRVAGMIDIW